MRFLMVVIVGLVGCKNVDDRIDAVEFTASDVDAAVCELADKDFDNEKARVVLHKHLLRGLENRSPLPPGNQKSGATCVIDQMLKAKENLPAPVLAVARFKLQYAKVTPVFDALPAAEKKEATLAAFAELGTRADLWSSSAETAAPLMIAELDKLGAAEDPRFFRGLVGANALYGGKVPVVKERLSKLGDDPRVAIAWREQLVAVVNIKDGVTSRDFVAQALKEFKARNVTLDKEEELVALLKACANSYGRETCDPLAPSLPGATKQALRTTLDKHSSESWASGAREFVMKMSGGTAADVPKILGGMEVSSSPDTDLERSPVTIPDPDNPVFANTVDMLTGIGPTAVPPLVESLKNDQRFYQLRAAAHALAKLDPATLAKLTTELLEAHDRRFDPRSSPMGSGGQLAAGLHALQATPGDDAVNVFLRALSSPDPEVSGMAGQVIKHRFERDKAIDALFGFMAAKDKYARREIDLYVGLVTEFGAEATPAVVKNLEALLAAAGAPAKVFWAHKVVGLMALKKVGTSAALDTVNKFSTDAGGYVDIVTPLDKNGKPTGKPRETKVPFKTLVDETVKAIALR